MSPTDTHLSLLRQLPPEVQERLREYSPGFTIGKTAFEHVLRHTPKSWEGDDPWLPCDPTAILNIAADLSNKEGKWQHDWMATRELGRYYATLVDGNDVDTDELLSFGDDPHEAALRLLLSVCGEKP